MKEEKKPQAGPPEEPQSPETAAAPPVPPEEPAAPSAAAGEASADAEEHSFLSETFKDETKAKKNVAKRLAILAGKAVLFGLVASLVFSVTKPWFDRHFHEDTITISEKPQETEEKEEPQPAEEEATPQETAAQTDQNISSARSGVAREVEKSVVEITGVLAEDQEIGASFDTQNSVAGVLLADSGNELMIYAKTAVTKDATRLTATFCDGRTYEATLKKQEKVLGYGVYAVAKTNLSESTLSQLKIATLGSSATVARGDTAIAVGKPFGVSQAIGYGAIASVNAAVAVTDGEYNVLTTDLAGSAAGSGVIANMDGEIVGLIDPAIAAEGNRYACVALGISDIKNRAQLLVNNTSVPYFGITGYDIDQDMAAKGLVVGVYVKNVEVDSPAMKAGIQKGDIITQFADKDVVTFRGLCTELLGQRSNQEIKVKGMRRGAGDKYVDVSFTVTLGEK